jgi:hypothetical protein
MDTTTRQIIIGETDYQYAKKIVRLVREFDDFRQRRLVEGTTVEDREAICDKFFSTLISQEAFKKLLEQYSQADGYVDAIMKRLPRDMWIFLLTYFDVAEEPSELPMWYITKAYMLLAALSVFDLDNYGYSLQFSVTMPFRDLIEILLTHYEKLSLFKKPLTPATTKEEVKEEPIITEV